MQTLQIFISYLVLCKVKPSGPIRSDTCSTIVDSLCDISGFVGRSITRSQTLRDSSRALICRLHCSCRSCIHRRACIFTDSHLMQVILFPQISFWLKTTTDGSSPKARGTLTDSFSNIYGKKERNE